MTNPSDPDDQPNQRLLILDALTPWIASLFAALPAGWTAHYLGPVTAGLSLRRWLQPGRSKLLPSLTVSEGKRPNLVEHGGRGGSTEDDEAVAQLPQCRFRGIAGRVFAPGRKRKQRARTEPVAVRIDRARRQQ